MPRFNGVFWPDRVAILCWGRHRRHGWAGPSVLLERFLFLSQHCCVIPFTIQISMSGRQDETFELKSPEDYFFSGAIGEYVEVACHDLINMIPSEPQGAAQNIER